MNTIERIKQYIDHKGINIRKFELSVGFSNGSFGSQLKNKKSIGVDKLENILNVYSDINPTWLITGEGTMLKTPVSLYRENETPVGLYRDNETPVGLLRENKSNAGSPYKEDLIDKKDKQIALLNQEIGMLKYQISELQKKLTGK